MGGSVSSLWTLSVLLLYFFQITVQNPVPNVQRRASVSLHEFNINVNEFGNFLTDCPEECSSNTTEGKCRCLHIDVPELQCRSSHYYTVGLENLLKANQEPHASVVEDLIKPLIQDLGAVRTSEQEFLQCFPSGGCAPHISPKTFHGKLRDLKECIASMMSAQ